MLSSGAAVAFGCVGEETIWVYVNNSTTGTGSQNNFDIADRSLSSCSNAEAHSTAHLGSTSAAKQVEVGFKETNPSGNDPPIKVWHVFWAAQNGNTYNTGTVCCYDPPISACCHWKVVYSSQYDTFRYFYGSGGTPYQWTEVVPSGHPHGFPQNLVGFTQGWPKGETGRFGGDGTGMMDTHSHLMRFTGVGGSWVDWSDNNVQDILGTPNWRWCFDSATKYHIERNDRSC
jgi:hypothetical protein